MANSSEQFVVYRTYNGSGQYLVERATRVDGQKYRWAKISVSQAQPFSRSGARSACKRYGGDRFTEI